MAPYTMKSDKIFLRCFDMQALEVYELDSLYSAPIKGKYWEHLTSIRPGNNKAPYNTLKMGDKEIDGPDLEKLMKDLYHSRLMVNREGLCFLATAGMTAELFGVEFYRTYDVFDWSKYQVKASVNTVWTRRDIKEGRPIVMNHGDGNKEEFEKKLEEEKLKHKTELEEANRKHKEELKKKQDEIDEVKSEKNPKEQEQLQKKQEEIEGLKSKHKVEMESLERKNKEQVQKKQADIDGLKRKNNELEIAERKTKEEMQEKQAEIDDMKHKNNELEIAERKNKEEMPEKQAGIDDLKHKNNEAPNDELYFTMMISRCRWGYPSKNFYVDHLLTFYPFKWKMESKVIRPRDIKITEEMAASIWSGERLDKMDVDQDNWFVIAGQQEDYNYSFGYIVYYEGNSNYYTVKDQNVEHRVPMPTSNTDKMLSLNWSFSYGYIRGIGYRFMKVISQRWY